MASVLENSDFSPYGTGNRNIVFGGGVDDDNLIVVASTMRSGTGNSGYAISTTTTNAKNDRLEDLIVPGDATFRRATATLDWISKAADGGTYAGSWVTGTPAHVSVGLEFSGVDSFTAVDGNDNGATADETDLASVGSVSAGGDVFTAGASFTASNTTNNGLSGQLLAYLVSGSTFLLIGFLAIKKNSANPTALTITWDGDLSSPTGQAKFEGGSNQVHLAYAFKEVTAVSGTTIPVFERHLRSMRA